MNAVRRWVHRVTVKQICDIQKDRPAGIADSMYECIAAWRYYEAIELLLQGKGPEAFAIAAKVRTDKFTDTDALLRLQARIGTTYRQYDPFTDTCVAAHQQKIDWERLSTGTATQEQYARIVARHERYKLAQPELTSDADAGSSSEGRREETARAV